MYPDDLAYGDDYANSVMNKLQKRGQFDNASQMDIDADSNMRMEQLRETQSFRNLVFVNNSGKKNLKPTLHSNASQAAIASVNRNEMFPKVT